MADVIKYTKGLTMRIAVVDYKNPVMKKAMEMCPEYDFVACDTVEEACEKINASEADALIAGIDITTREMVLACKARLKKTSAYFSSCFLMEKDDQKIIVADAGICKNPSAEMMKDIIIETHRTAKKLLRNTPRVALLSYSSFGSGGNDPTTSRILEAMRLAKEENPEMVIDGEMQLDVAICPQVAAKKAGNSEVAGRANVLICPDLNAGNILYKSMERFGGFTAAGPILQGFDAVASDLSRGSTAEDVVLTFRVLEKLHKKPSC